MQKELEECKETSSQLKRRRMLQFKNQDANHSISNEQMSSECLKSNVSASSFSL